MRYADVIVPLAVGGMFTYAVPDGLDIRPGMLVMVPFGSDKKYTALTVSVHGRKPEGYSVREMEGPADGRLMFSDLHVRFLLWMAEYYMACPGEVLKAALPVVFRLESHTVVIRTLLEPETEGLSPHERGLLERLKPGQELSLKEAAGILGGRNAAAAVRKLMEKGYVQVKEHVDELFREKKEYRVCWASEAVSGRKESVLEGLKRAAGQYRMLAFWIEAGKPEWERGAFLKASGGSAAVLKALCGKGVLRTEVRTVSRWKAEEVQPAGMHELAPEQQKAFEDVRALFRERDCVLLRGVTSSGKTEVYIHLISEYVRNGFQVLYMLPEIALTVQMVRRLKGVFGDEVGIYHSGMSDQMRAELWTRQCSDRPFRLILGVRSSIFLPFSRLGLVIVDEEHDASYKQKEPAPRYNGRDAAVMLAKMYGAHVLLGTATPSFESWNNACSGKYGLVEMDRRYGGVSMPEIILADLNEARRKKVMKGSFSPLLVGEIRKVLDAGKQVILFQNRRGYSSYLQCDGCGDIPRCRHCDVGMTYYKKRNIMVCRYCGAISPVPEVCPHCGGHYRERTPGTERVEEEAAALFPDSRTVRMDLEVMGSRGQYRKVIGSFERGEYDILVGTQMVAKGLDFGNVSLVGVMNADSMLSMPDFRAEERAYNMLMQVSGRCGRRDERGKVVIQTADVSNRLYAHVMKGDFPSFFARLSEERRMFDYPPYGRLIQIEMRHRDAVVLREAANFLAGCLRERLGRRVCGPAVPEVGRISSQFRLVLLLKLEAGLPLSGVRRLLRETEERVYGRKGWKGVRLVFDVDP